MSTDQTLARIDATLDDYDQWNGHSPDAARWAGGPTEGEWGDELGEPQEFQRVLADVMERYSFPQRVILGAEHAEQHVRFRDPESPSVRARLDAIEEMTQACGLTMTDWQRVILSRWIDPVVPLKYFPPKRPMAAAERTSSPQRRAGSRRVKRQARRRHG